MRTLSNPIQKISFFNTKSNFLLKNLYALIYQKNMFLRELILYMLISSKLYITLNILLHELEILLAIVEIFNVFFTQILMKIFLLNF